ncbi:MAG: hypothetical protein L0332_35760 [Chloroflexi bacterium]|nr:hypothetical protein [Chloroflexota bacterium]
MPILHMETNTVQNTGNLLQQTADSLTQQTQQLMQAVQNLAGVWQGDSRELFMAEIEPLLRQGLRLADAGSILNRRLQQEVAEWLQTDAAFGRGGPAGAGEYTRPYTVPDVELPKPEWKFNPDSIIDYNPYAVWQGADQEKLGQAMSDFSYYLQDNPDVLKPPYLIPSELKTRLEALAGARGVSYDEMLGEYAKFVQLTNGTPPSSTPRDDYWGTVQQLRFGMVVGDTLGIDPVFGSLLDPTGGLIGPGDGYEPVNLQDPLGNLDFMNYHAVYHDAAGYLHYAHNVGPGFEYIVPEAIDTAVETAVGGPFLQLLLQQHPEYDGQVTGITYWALRLRANDAAQVVTGLTDNIF